MPTKFNKVDNKKSLEAYKDKLVKEIYYYDKKIGEARNNLANKPASFEDEISSDSDSELSLVLDTGPSLLELKSQQAMLKTCLQATQELTNLEVLESEVNVLLEEPTFEREPRITQPGTWREVMADCCVDLVPFNITFYAHQGEGKFAPILYRGLKVLLLKSSHEAELAKSILPDLRRPSDAVEVLRSYAVAHRSRRSTLARLADKFGAALFMEPKESGGYMLKCAGLLEVSWSLQNKWSPIAPFHHRLKFDIEYMDESYIKTITQAHRQLSDPAVDTDERTLLLATIVSTCLAAAPLEPASPRSHPGDVTPAHQPPGKRRTTLDREPDVPNMKRKKDSEVMAPPKTLPKKVKPKVSSAEKKNTSTKPTKRLLQEDKTNDNVKKPKTDKNVEDHEKNEVNNENETSAMNSKPASGNKSNPRSVSDKGKKEKSVVNSKPEEKDRAGTHENNDAAEYEEFAKEIQNPANVKKVSKKETSGKKATENEMDAKNKVKPKSVKTSIPLKNAPAIRKSNEVVPKISKTNTISKDAPLLRSSMSNIRIDDEHQTNPAKARNSAPSKNYNTNDKDKINAKIIKPVKSSENVRKSGTVEKKVSQKDGNVKKVVENEKVVALKKIAKNIASDPSNVPEKISVANQQKQVTKPSSNLPKKSTVINKVPSTENVKKSINSAQKIKKPLNEQNVKSSKTENQNTLKKVTNALKAPSSTNVPGIKKTTTSRVEKENKVQNKIVYSKIPQKKMVSPKSVIKKMPVRASPRQALIKSKTPLGGVKKIVQKPVTGATGIPRLLTKPRPKVM